MFRNRYGYWLLVSFVVLSGATVKIFADTNPGLLVVHPDNSRYFMVKDDPDRKVVFLTGSHTWHEFQDYYAQGAFPYSTWLSDLQSWGHNFMRGWHWEDGYYSPLPYAMSGTKYDLNNYNTTYFDRVKSRVEQAAAQGMYVSIMLFEGWSVDNGYSSGKPSGYRNPNPWPVHPYDGSNNINGINGDPNNDDDGGETHQLIISSVTAKQEAYVSHCIDQFNYLDNIIWEISNESRSYSVSWQYHMVNYIRSYEAANYPGREHLIWMNARGDWNNSSLYNSPAEVISPNNGSEDYLNNPPQGTGSKVIIADTDHIQPVSVTYVWAWKSFARGLQPILMDPGYDGLSWWQGSSLNPSDPKWNQIRNALGHILAYANKMNLADMIPQAKGTSFPCTTGYLLYNSGEEYLAYQPVSGSFTINLPSGVYDYEWIHPISGTNQTGTINWGGGNKSFTPPFSGDAALYLGKGGKPVAVINADPTVGYSPLTVNFDGTYSYDSDGGTIVSYQWDFENDGVVDDTSATASHEYNAVDTYTAKLTVTDNNGLEGSSTITIAVVYPIGDFDGDNDVDQEDFGHIQECMTGNGNPQEDPNCANALLDVDDDVDSSDFAIFQDCMSGPNIPQTNENCLPS